MHIESPYKSIADLNGRLADRLIEESQSAFRRLVEVCIAEEVDFLVLAGDAFDSGSGNLGAQLRFLEGMKRLDEQGIKVYLICGNHDPLDQWSDYLSFPGNVHIFGGEEVERLEFYTGGQLQAAIYGVSYLTQREDRKLVNKYSAEAEDPFSIGLLHGNFGSDTGHANYAPFTTAELRAAGMDYWALGHIHKREVINEERPLAIYPGNLQGRHFNETGRKGCMKVEVEAGRVSDYQFLPLSEVVFERYTLDITDIEELETLDQRLNQLREELDYPKEVSVLLRLTLTGATPLHRSLDEEEVRKFWNQRCGDFSDVFMFIDTIVNTTRPPIHIEERRQSPDFVGYVLRRFEEYEKNPKALQELSDEIFEELRRSQFKKYIPDLSEDELKEALELGQWELITSLIEA